MNMITQRLEKHFQLTQDLAKNLPNEHLRLTLKDLPSNTIGEQFWCIVGARESYLRAMIHEKWMGFSCTLEETTSIEKITYHLNESAEALMSYFKKGEGSETQMELMFTLLEHEVQHHGQLIRYVYGNKLSFPHSWKERYNV